MSELEMFITWLKSKDGAFLDTTDVPKVIVWLEELKAIKSDGVTDNLLDMRYIKGYQQGREDAIEEFVKM